MFFQLLMLALVVGLIVFYAFEGLFSAMLMALCSILAAVLAFNFYEPLAGALLGTIGRMADAVALALLFIAVLALLRIAADKLLGGMVHFPFWADRIGGAALGAVAALIVIGVLVICVRMLPFGPSVMGYQGISRVEADESRVVGAHGNLVVEPLWLKPDGFTVAVVNKLSAGSLSNSGGQSFQHVHPDYLAEQAGFGRFAAGTREPFMTAALGDFTYVLQAEQEPKNKTAQEAGRSPKTTRALGRWMEESDLKESQFSKDPKDQDEMNRLASFVKAKRVYQVTLRINTGAEEEVAALTAAQAQLTCRRDSDNATAMVVPQWIAGRVDQNIEPKIEPFRVEKAWSFNTKAPPPSSTFVLRDQSGAVISAFAVGGGPLATPLVALYYLVPPGFNPWYLTVKRDTRIDPMKIEPKQTLTIQWPANLEAGIVTTWLSNARWKKAVSADMPFSISAVPTTTPDGAARVNPKLANARLNLTSDKISFAELKGPVGRFWDLVSSGRPVHILAEPPGRKIVQLVFTLVEAMPAEDWTNLLTTATVTAKIGNGEEGGAIAGFVVMGKDKDQTYQFFYDQKLAPKQLASFAPTGPPSPPEADAIILLVAIPTEAKSFELAVSESQFVTVNLGKQ